MIYCISKKSRRDADFITPGFIPGDHEIDIERGSSIPDEKSTAAIMNRKNKRRLKATSK